MNLLKLHYILFVFLLLSFLNLATSHRTCGANEPTEEEKQDIDKLVEERLRGRTFPRGQRIIPVMWHVVHDGDAGMIGPDVIYESIGVLNEAFADTPFQFFLDDTTYTNHSRWFTVDSAPDQQLTTLQPELFEMTASLRRGDCSTLNIFSHSPTRWNGINILFPFMLPPIGNCRNTPDAVFMHYQNLPGGSRQGYNSGHLLVHEAGHWLGLFHTFAGGCTGLGDLVADTPAQRSEHQGCPADEQPDTCPGLSGLDPIQNYMGYSNDDCTNEFSRGQVRRMVANFNAFRANDALSLVKDFGACFSPYATAIVKEKGTIPMKGLAAGDEVLTGSGQYRTVYTINHFHHTQQTDFVQIHTDLVGNNTENALELSPMHLVYIEGKEHPIPAMDVRVGDYVKTLDYGPQRVTGIERITRNGMYNPITTDGTMLVDGIVASSYTTFTGSAYLEIAGVKLISVHKLLNMTIAPYRAFCMRTSSLEICNRHDEGELPKIVQLLGKFYVFWSHQYVPIQFLIIGFYLSIFSVINFIMSGCGIVLLAATACQLCMPQKRNNKRLSYLV